MDFILWQAAQALAFLTKKSCSELAIHEPNQIHPNSKLFRFPNQISELY